MKQILFILVHLLYLSGYSQTADVKGKFFSGINIGYVQIYNNMLLPYEFSGTNYGINLERQIFYNHQWLFLSRFSIGYASSFVKDMAIDIPIFNTNRHSLKTKLQYNLLRQLGFLSEPKFRVFAGAGIDIQPEIELFLHRDIQKYFLRTDLGLNYSLFAEYDWGNIKISDSFTMPIVIGSFYPHYNTIPFYSVGKTHNYFLFATINKIIRLNNKLNVEIPVNISKKTLTTVRLSYIVDYEYSSIRDNKIRIIGHQGLIGFVFNICN